MDGRKENQSLASMALELMQQIAPAVFTGLSVSARQAIVDACVELDTVSQLRQADAVKEAVKAARGTPSSPGIPAGIGDDGRIAFIIPEQEIARADEQGVKADECVAHAQGLDWGTGPGPGFEHAGQNAAAQAAALVSLAHSAREACIMLRSIAATLEHAHAPIVDVPVIP